MRQILPIIILLFAGLGIQISRQHLYLNQAAEVQELPPFYLPEIQTVRLITLGFDPFFSDVIWFSTINYFGKQFHGNGDYRWFKQRCDLVLKLQPKAHERFDFCAVLLAWVAKDTNASNDILNQAVSSFPDDWRFYYLRGFNYWYFEGKEKEGAADLTKAASLPDAPAMLPSLAARLLSSDPTAAIQFLSESLKRTTDPVATQALTERLKQAQMTFDLAKLTELVGEFKNKFQKSPESLEELRESGLLKFIPHDPYGKEYQLQNGVIISRSGKKGLEFNRNTPLSSSLKSNN